MVPPSMAFTLKLWALSILAGINDMIAIAPNRGNSFIWSIFCFYNAIGRLKVCSVVITLLRLARQPHISPAGNLLTCFGPKWESINKRHKKSLYHSIDVRSSQGRGPYLPCAAAPQGQGPVRLLCLHLQRANCCAA